MPRVGKAIALVLAAASVLAFAAGAQKKKSAPARRPAESARDRELAARFAPVFRQGLGDDRRADYLTNFDFDGDWRGDNNWEHAADPRFRLKAYVYYALSETATHYFIHYAVFHPRDYKGGGLRGPLLSEAIRQGVKRGGRYDPTGLSGAAVLAHENDMEGCLVVVAKGAPERVVMVETVAHDRFLKYVPEGGTPAGFEKVALEGDRPRLYIEPKGHGVSAAPPGDEAARRDVLTYHFGGAAGDPEESGDGRVAYELLPLLTTLWPRALKGVNETYGSARAYRFDGLSAVRAGSARGVKVSVTAGSAFLGKVGAANMARPPWGWFDRGESASAPGAWFFDPAATVKRHFGLGDSFATAYVHAPFLGVTR